MPPVELARCHWCSGDVHEAAAYFQVAVARAGDHAERDYLKLCLGAIEGVCPTWVS